MHTKIILYSDTTKGINTFLKNISFFTKKRWSNQKNKVSLQT